MYKKFEKIDISTEKVKNIINAGFEVFSKNSFEKASTNDIVKKANVSRGLLYHYFKNKEELFDYLVYYATKTILIDMSNSIDWNENDIFERIRKAIHQKLQVLHKNPFIFDFHEKHSERITEESVLIKAEEISPGFNYRFYNHNLNYELKNPDTDIQMMIQVLNWTLTGVVKDNWKNGKNTAEVLEKVDQYIILLKSVFIEKNN